MGVKKELYIPRYLLLAVVMAVVIVYLWITIPLINTFLIHKFPYINDAQEKYLQMCNFNQTERYILQNCTGATPMGSSQYATIIATTIAFLICVFLFVFTESDKS